MRPFNFTFACDGARLPFSLPVCNVLMGGHSRHSNHAGRRCLNRTERSLSISVRAQRAMHLLLLASPRDSSFMKSLGSISFSHNYYSSLSSALLSPLLFSPHFSLPLLATEISLKMEATIDLYSFPLFFFPLSLSLSRCILLARQFLESVSLRECETREREYAEAPVTAVQCEGEKEREIVRSMQLDVLVIVSLSLLRHSRRF